MQVYYHTETHLPDENRFVADFVSRRIWGTEGALRDCATMGVVRDGSLVGGVVFHEYRPEVNTMQLSIAGDRCRWLTRGVVNSAMHFAFDLMKVSAIWAMVDDRNEAALRMDRIIFPNQSRVRHAFGEDLDGWMMTLSQKEWLAHRLYRPIVKG